MKNTVVTIQQMKEKGEKISMLTAYDYSTAKLEDEAGVNTILVGDSLGNVILGYEDTISVTMEDMIHHGAAVARGAKNALVVVDMPFMSYQTSVLPALRLWCGCHCRTFDERGTCRSRETGRRKRSLPTDSGNCGCRNSGLCTSWTDTTVD